MDNVFLLVDKLLPYLLGGGGLFGVYLTYKRAVTKDKSESDLKEESQSFTQLEKVVDQMRLEIDRLKQDHSEERRLWHEERREFTKEIKNLNIKNAESDKTIAILQTTVDLLKKHDTTAVKKIAKEL